MTQERIPAGRQSAQAVHCPVLRHLLRRGGNRARYRWPDKRRLIISARNAAMGRGYAASHQRRSHASGQRGWPS
jgi:hypothetical protein